MKKCVFKTILGVGHKKRGANPNLGLTNPFCLSPSPSLVPSITRREGSTLDIEVVETNNEGINGVMSGNPH